MNQRALVKVNQSGLPAAAAVAAREYVNASKASNTRRAYQSAWAEFEIYCQRHALRALPASVGAVTSYLVDLVEAGKKASTLQVKLSAISFNHANALAPNPVKTPEIRSLMTGIRRSIGTAPSQKAPAIIDDIRRIVCPLPADLRGKRDKAILLIGFAGAFRRSELVSLAVEDVRFSDVGVTITLRRSKTDQEGAGMIKTIPALQDLAICPVRALREWMDSARIDSGIVFRPVGRWGHVQARAMNGREIARIIKARMLAAGMDARQFAGHSLRAGYVTTCVNAGVPTWAIRQQTGHRGERAFEKYIRNAGLGAAKATRAAFGE